MICFREKKNHLKNTKLFLKTPKNTVLSRSVAWHGCYPSHTLWG